VIEHVAAALNKQKTAPATLMFDRAAALAAVIGTHNSTRWAGRKNTDWGTIAALEDAGESEITQKIWEQVRPVLAARLRYQVVVDCEPQYVEALAQAVLLNLGNEDALLVLAVKALPDKAAKSGKKKAK